MNENELREAAEQLLETPTELCNRVMQKWLVAVLEEMQDRLNTPEPSSDSPSSFTPTEDEIKAMVDRFLSWPLPEDFSPDAGIEFEPEYNHDYNASRGLPPSRHSPTGTNLFDADQAKAMIKHIFAI